jgi:hypothetical protein
MHGRFAADQASAENYDGLAYFSSTDVAGRHDVISLDGHEGFRAHGDHEHVRFFLSHVFRGHFRIQPELDPRELKAALEGAYHIVDVFLKGILFSASRAPPSSPLFSQRRLYVPAPRR